MSGYFDVDGDAKKPVDLGYTYTATLDELSGKSRMVVKF